jgi:hypothetical protein
MSIRQRLYPTPGQFPVLSGYVQVTAASQMRELTEARWEFPWLAGGSTAVQQGALRDLDRNFWAGQ